MNNETRIYGDKNPKFSLSYSGFVSGDIENVVTGTPVFNTAANEKSFVGSYDVNVSGLTSKNYDIAFDKGTLEITPRALTVALEDKSQVYGAEETELTYSLSQPLIDSEGSPLVVSMSRATGNISPVKNWEEGTEQSQGLQFIFHRDQSFHFGLRQ